MRILSKPKYIPFYSSVMMFHRELGIVVENVKVKCSGLGICHIYELVCEYCKVSLNYKLDQ